VCSSDLVDSLGGQFTAEGTVNGQLAPVGVSGVLSSNYNQVESLSYFWYGCSGTGDSTIVPFLSHAGKYLGFIFTPPMNKYGKMVTTSDQDWVRIITSEALLENILFYLCNTPTGIDEKLSHESAESFTLQQNYPNPFNPTTTISYQLKTKSNVQLTIFDIAGREIKTLVNKSQNTGSHTVDFNASGLSSGIYIYKLTTSLGFVQSRKMVVLK